MHFPPGHPLLHEAAAAREHVPLLITAFYTAIGSDLIGALVSAHDIASRGPDICHKVRNDRAAELGKPVPGRVIRRELELNCCPMMRWWGGRFRCGDFRSCPRQVEAIFRTYLLDTAVAQKCHIGMREQVDRGTKVRRANRAKHSPRKEEDDRAFLHAASYSGLSSFQKSLGYIILVVHISCSPHAG
jgi:hypothetical protein